jgi:hypothetical protein
MAVQVRDLDPGLIELFVDGKEDGLPDAGRLRELGLGSGSVVFPLFRQGGDEEEEKPPSQFALQQEAEGTLAFELASGKPTPRLLRSAKARV